MINNKKYPYSVDYDVSHSCGVYVKFPLKRKLNYLKSVVINIFGEDNISYIVDNEIKCMFQIARTSSGISSKVFFKNEEELVIFKLMVSI